MKLRAMFLSCYKNISKILDGIADLHIIHKLSSSKSGLENKKSQQNSTDRATVFPFVANIPIGSMFLNQCMETLLTLGLRKHN